MNIVQAGPTPVVAAAAAPSVSRPAENTKAELPAKAVKPAPKSETAARYAAHQAEVRHGRGHKVDIEA